MKFLVHVICVTEAAERHQQEVFEIERENLALETLGLSLVESKSLLQGVQEFVVAEQVADDLERRRPCPDCCKRHTSKGQGSIEVKTVFGTLKVPNPRWHRCSCQSIGPSTFRPTTRWLSGQTSPELLYLETKWASLIPYAKVVELLKDVLPVADTLNQETVRNHLHATADRIEQGLGQEPVSLFDGSDQDWEEQPLPDGPITVGIDGGFVRAAHKEGWFEVIAGKSVVAFRREDNDETPSAKCFGFVQTYDEKPRRRLWELLKSQGMQENQQVVFLSDGGETVRRLQEYLHPSSEHLIDWFHITMQLTVLQQQRKALQAEQPQIGEAIAKQLESVKHLLWHGNAEEALERLGGLIIELDLLRAFSHAADKLGQGIGEFETYIRNNIEFIPNFGVRYRQGETISTAFVESTINQVVSKRFVKKQQMQWTLRGAHLLLQTRTKVLNNDLEDVFRSWYPQFHAQAA
jgi:hypothetical protein